MLRNTLYKLKNSSQLNVAFFGGSITEGAGASDAEKTCWRAKITQWLKDSYPTCEIVPIMAAIGGTGTDLGVYRCDNDVSVHKPDLVFFEFSVNDSDCKDYDFLINNTESIFRKIYKANPTADIIVLHTTTNRIVEGLSKGVEYLSRTAHATVAHHYGAPIIDIGEVLRCKVHADGEDWLKYTVEGVHPLDKGYEIYAECIKNTLTDILSNSVEIEKPVDKQLPDYIVRGYLLENAGMVDYSKAEYSDGWTKYDETLCGRYPRYIESDKTGAELTFKFTGRNIGLYWALAPDGGDIEYTVDGKLTGVGRAWDEWSIYDRRVAIILLAENLEYGEHTVTVKVKGTKDDRSKGYAVRIGTFAVS